MKTCAKCHFINEDTCNYCVKCGSFLNQPLPQPPDPRQSAPQISPKTDNKPKKNNIAIVALFFFLLTPIWLLFCFVLQYPSWATFKNIPFLAAVVVLVFALRNAKKFHKKRILSAICTVLCVLNILLIAVIFWDTTNYNYRLSAEVCAVQSLEEQLKDPDSLEIHEIAVCQYEDMSMFENYYSVYIDYSAANSFGAQVRDTATYTFFAEEDDSGNTHLYSTSTELPYFRDGGTIYSASEVESWMFAWYMD